MSQLFRCNLSDQKCLIYRILYLLVWAYGLYLGVSVFHGTGNSSSYLMRGIFTDPVTIVSLFSVCFVPFLFSAFAVFIGLPQLLYLVCISKAFSFGFVSCAVHSVFGYAGWLVQLLLMFTELFTVPLLLLYGVRHISGDRSFSFSEVFFAAALLALIGSIDYCFVSPLLAML